MYKYYLCTGISLYIDSYSKCMSFISFHLYITFLNVDINVYQ
nr:MAG TPA: hypothetical protein [Caudoviricetes sp.]